MQISSPKQELFLVAQSSPCEPANLTQRIALDLTVSYNTLKEVAIQFITSSCRLHLSEEHFAAYLPVIKSRYISQIESANQTGLAAMAEMSVRHIQIQDLKLSIDTEQFQTFSDAFEKINNVFFCLKQGYQSIIYDFRRSRAYQSASSHD